MAGTPKRSTVVLEELQILQRRELQLQADLLAIQRQIVEKRGEYKVALKAELKPSKSSRTGSAMASPPRQFALTASPSGTSTSEPPASHQPAAIEQQSSGSLTTHAPPRAALCRPFQLPATQGGCASCQLFSGLPILVGLVAAVRGLKPERPTKAQSLLRLLAVAVPDAGPLPSQWSVSRAS